jgi:hypothetical protein
VKSRIPIEVVVGVLAAVSCLATLPKLGLPLWALFVGWAWYFALGAKLSVFKQAYPSALAGIIVAAFNIWFLGVLSKVMPGFPALVISVGISVFLLMLVLKIPFTSCSLAGFNGFSITFAAFLGGAFPKTGNPGTDIVMAALWVAIASFIGLWFGYFSVVFTLPIKDEAKSK